MHPRTLYLTGLLGLLTLLLSTQAAAELSSHALETQLVPSPVKYQVLTPPSPTKQTEGVTHGNDSAGLPLFLWLHGGGGDAEFLSRNRILFERAWSRKLAPPMVVVTPDAKRSFYLDYRDGSQKWESFLIKELLPRLQQDYPIDVRRIFVGGVSMGGMGSLRLAFKYPEIFQIVVALEPGIEPALAWKDVQPRDSFYRAEKMMQQRFGDPMDEAYWAANNPASIAAVRSRELIESGLKIYLEVGSEDLFGLYRGAEYLHRLLYDKGIKHEYRYVLGADHVGNSLAERITNALAFMGRMSTPPKPDPTLKRTRRMVWFLKKRAGIDE